MLPRTSQHSVAASGVLAAAVLLTLLPQPATAARSKEMVTVAVIVGSKNKAREMSRQQLRHIFTAQPMTGPDGKRLVPLNHPPRTPDRVGFDRKVLGMTSEQVGRYWIDRRIRTGTRPPRTVDSVSTLRRLVERLPGAIAYLRPSQATGDLRMLEVDGKQPGEAGYPIVYRR